MIDNEYYTNRIITANDAELISIMYELLIENIKQCIINMSNEDERIIYVKKCKKIISEFFVITEGNNEISNNVRSILLFVNQLIDEGYLLKDVDKYKKSIEIINPLKEAWDELGQCSENIDAYGIYGSDNRYTHNNFNEKG